MSAALYNVYARRHGDGTRPIGIFNSRDATVKRFEHHRRGS